MITDCYIDVHSHILPNVDDGPRSMDDTIEMLKIGHQQGIRTIIATPHYACGSKNKSVEDLQTIRDQVQAEAHKINEDYRILLGHELYYSESIVEALKSQQALTLAGSRYGLVEFSVTESYKIIYQGLKEFIMAGYAPILAHTERYHCLRKREDLIQELIQLGAYIQMNSSSLKGGLFNSEASYNRRLLRNGMVHLIGSDSHNTSTRKPLMDEVIDVLYKKIDNNLLDQILIDNPNTILGNKYI